MKLVVRALKDERRTLDADECAALLRMTRRRALPYLQHLHAAGKAHIKQWRRTSKSNVGKWKPVFAHGAGVDAVRPEAVDDTIRRRELRKAARLVRRDPIVTALFGKAPRKRR